MTEFLTDGVKLYEVAGVDAQENFGLTGGVLSRTILRDCAAADDDEVWVVDDLTLAALSEVRRAA